MKISQLSVFLENRPHSLLEPLQALAAAQIDLSGLALADSEQFGILRLVLRDWARARALLQSGGWAVTVTDMVAIQVEDQPGGWCASSRCSPRPAPTSNTCTASSCAAAGGWRCCSASPRRSARSPRSRGRGHDARRGRVVLKTRRFLQEAARREHGSIAPSPIARCTRWQRPPKGKTVAAGAAPHSPGREHRVGARRREHGADRPRPSPTHGAFRWALPLIAPGREHV